MRSAAAWASSKMRVYIYRHITIFNITARPYGWLARLTWNSNINIILRHAQKPVQGQCFGFYQTTTLNPKALNPKTPKP
jgi:hypothetical protein